MTLLPDPREVPTLTVEQAARIVGVSRSTAYEAIARGSLPSLRFGRRVVVPTVAVYRLLGMVPPGTDRENK